MTPLTKEQFFNNICEILELKSGEFSFLGKNIDDIIKGMSEDEVRKEHRGSDSMDYRINSGIHVQSHELCYSVYDGRIKSLIDFISIVVPDEGNENYSAEKRWIKAEEVNEFYKDLKVFIEQKYGKKDKEASNKYYTVWQTGSDQNSKVQISLERLSKSHDMDGEATHFRWSVTVELGK